MSSTDTDRSGAGARLPAGIMVVIVSALMVTVPAGSLGVHQASEGPVTGMDDLQLVPEATEGFTIQPLAGAPAPSAITFGPGGDLFATLLTGQVLRYDLAYTDAGPVVQGVSQFASGFSLPLGLAFDDAGNLYVSDSHDHPNPDVSHTMGRVWKVDASSGQQDVIVDNLPNGQHNTNHIRFGPDGLLYLPNGNPNDHGNGTGTGQVDVFPYSGAFLAVDVNGVDADLPDTTPANPAVLEWEDGNGDAIEPDDISDHPLNEDFDEQVEVFAFGFRNIFGITFAPDDLPFAGAAYTGMNGADDPSSQDSVYKITPGENHGFPFCYNAGDPGAVGDDVSKIQNPDSPNPSITCEDTPRATALLGWHICATGVDFPTEAEPGRSDATFPDDLEQSLFVAECGPFFLDDTVDRSAEQGPSTHNNGHKIARIALDQDGEATMVRDFVTGLALPTDVQFGPDGAMYIADAGTIYRVAPTPDAPVEPTVPVGAVGQSFLPQAAVVPTGVPVTWASGPLPHTVTTTDELCKPLVDPTSCQGNDLGNDDGEHDTFHHALSGAGSTVTHTFETQGVHAYNCQIHYTLGMIGVVIAVDTMPAAADLPAPLAQAYEQLPSELDPFKRDGDAVIRAL